MPLTLDRGVITFGRGVGLLADPSQLWMFGRFEEVGTVEVDGLAVWDGVELRAAAGGFDAVVYDILVTGSGGDAVVYAAGDFQHAPGIEASFVAERRDGAWRSIGEFNRSVRSLMLFDSGDGPQLHAAGRFTEIDGQAISGVARWDGASWHPLGLGIPTSDPGFGPLVDTMAVYDDGRGLALYVGGEFAIAGSLPARALARWDGASWEPVGRGVEGQVVDLAIHDFDGQERLVVVGRFTRAGGLAGVDVRNVAAWDGTNWHDVAGGANDNVLAVASLGDGPDASLFIGGQFDEVGGISASNIAMLSGEYEWFPLGGGVTSRGVPRVIELLPARVDGVESMLVGGVFEAADGFIAGSLAAYSPAEGWRNMGGDFVSSLGGTERVETLALDESGTKLWAGGSFERVSGVEAVRIAERTLDCGCVADCDGDAALTLFDFLCFQSAFDRGESTADCDGDGSLTLFDFLCFQSAFASGCP